MVFFWWYVLNGSSLPPDVCRRTRVLFTLFLLLCAQWCPTHIVLCVLLHLSSSCFLYIVVSNTYCVVFLLYLSSSYMYLVASGLFILCIFGGVSVTHLSFFSALCGFFFVVVLFCLTSFCVMFHVSLICLFLIMSSVFANVIYL